MVDNSAFDDIPGTTVFTAERSRQGYHLNQFCMSLMKAPNRDRFHADERAYLDEWPMTEEQKHAVVDARLPADARPRRQRLLPVEDLRQRRPLLRAGGQHHDRA